MSLTLNGSDAPDTLAGAAGDDSLAGLGSADLLWGGEGADLLDGGSGADLMEGGAGDDTYVVDEAGDAVVEAPGEGSDTVIATLTWTLAADVEALVLGGEAAIDGTGNALANVITGDLAANRLSARGTWRWRSSSAAACASRRPPPPPYGSFSPPPWRRGIAGRTSWRCWRCSVGIRGRGSRRFGYPRRVPLTQRETCLQ